MKVGRLELTPTSVSQTINVEVGDESSYSFQVEAYHDGETGWHACVSMRSHGYVSAEAAILHLRHAAEHFVRMLSDE